ncbi:MAG: sensor histidine kinase [Myxococcales bacterium]
MTASSGGSGEGAGLQGDWTEAVFDQRDGVYAGLRVAALLAGLCEVWLAPAAVQQRTAVLEALAVFVAYSIVAYAVAWPLLAARRKPRFYALTAAADLCFLGALMAVSGGAHSPFYRALYLWVAMLAFYFGRRGGIVGSSAALALYAAFHAAARRATGTFASDGWSLAIQAGGLLMHGPLVGYLADRERLRAENLRAAHDRLVHANQRLLEDQARLVQTEKLSSIGLLASGLAHEVNNPLTGVIGCLRALRQDSIPAERRSQYFDTIADGLERIRTTVQSLLDFTRSRPQSLSLVDAAEMADACVRLVAPMAQEHRIQVAQRIAPREALLRADRAQLMQGLVNLLLNAAYASPPGGEVVLGLRRGPGHTGLFVADRGSGIPREALARVCDPFFTTKPEGEGTGLGLTVTLGIARAHGGDLEIESVEGQGTTVTLWVPDKEGAACSTS